MEADAPAGVQYAFDETVLSPLCDCGDRRESCRQCRDEFGIEAICASF